MPDLFIENLDYHQHYKHLLENIKNQHNTTTYRQMYVIQLMNLHKSSVMYQSFFNLTNGIVPHITKAT